MTGFVNTFIPWSQQYVESLGINYLIITVQEKNLSYNSPLFHICFKYFTSYDRMKTIQTYEYMSMSLTV